MTLGQGEGGEIELEVSARSDADGSEDTLFLNTTRDVEVCRIVPGNVTMGIALHSFRLDPGSDIGETMKAICALIEISPDRSDLRDTGVNGASNRGGEHPGTV